MAIEWFRDLAISIFAVVATLVLIFTAVVVFLYSRRLWPILDSAKAVAKKLEGVSARVENEVLRPVIEVVAFVRLLYQFIEGIKKFFRAKKGGSDEPER